MARQYDRRFGGINRLYGDVGASRLARAHICVVGIGGVGSWTVEALARSGVGAITAVDLDVVAESNTNRQIHALEGNYGKNKVDAIRDRVLAIQPDCQFQTIDDFVTPDNVDTLLPNGMNVLIDAIDQARAKVALVAWAKRQGVPVILSGAAGGKIDPARITIDDLSRTTQDPLLAKIRAALRREHGFPRDPKKKFGVSAVYSTEPIRYPQQGATCESDSPVTGLNCAGFGSSVCVTATFGMIAAAAAINCVVDAA